MQVEDTIFQWATLCNGFLVEAKWFDCGQIPKAKEYLKNGMVTSGIQVLLFHMLYLLGDHAITKINHGHAIILSVSKILRLWDDLVTAQVRNFFNYLKRIITTKKQQYYRSQKQSVNRWNSFTDGFSMKASVDK